MIMSEPKKARKFMKNSSPSYTKLSFPIPPPLAARGKHLPIAKTGRV